MMDLNFLSNPNTMLLLAALLGFTFANMLSKGLIITLIRIKVFKQGNIAVCLAHDLEDYYVPGNLDAGILTFKARKRSDNKDPKRILSIEKSVLDKAVYKTFNIQAIMVDDVKNSIYVRKNGSYDSVGGFNAEAMSEKMDTALKKPPEDEVTLMPARTFQIFMLLGLVVVGVLVYMVYSKLKIHDANTQKIYDLVISLQSSINTTARFNGLG